MGETNQDTQAQVPEIDETQELPKKPNAYAALLSYLNYSAGDNNSQEGSMFKADNQNIQPNDTSKPRRDYFLDFREEPLQIEGNPEGIDPNYEQPIGPDDDKE